MSKAEQYIRIIFSRRKLLPWPLALIPAVTCGFLAFVPFAFIAARRRTVRTRLALAAYLAGSIGEMVLAGQPDNSPWDGVGAITMITLMVAGTTHAFVWRETLTRRSLAEDVPAVPAAGSRPRPAPAPPVYASALHVDPTAELATRLQGMLKSVRIWAAERNDLSPASRRLLAETFVPLGSVVDHAAVGGHADAELRGVEGILTDYLPTSLQTYDRLPREFARTHRNPDGRTPSEELEVQLRLIRDRAGELAASLYGADALRMQEQSTFLQEKFGRSELDLH